MGHSRSVLQSSLKNALLFGAHAPGFKKIGPTMVYKNDDLCRLLKSSFIRIGDRKRLPFNFGRSPFRKSTRRNCDTVSGMTYKVFSFILSKSAL